MNSSKKGSGRKEERKRLFFSQKKRKGVRDTSRSNSSTPTRASMHVFNAASIVDYKREEFHLDFNSSNMFSSDKSTSDNFQSDEDCFKFKVLKKSLGTASKGKQVELE